MHDFGLTVRQARYGGWKTMSITRSIEQLAHSFNVGLTDKWNLGQDPVPVEGGDSCTVSLDDTLITTGYIDDDGIDYNARNRSLSFSGRSKTCDLVDCSAIHKPWRKTGILTIANDLCRPFGIDVTTNTLTGSKFTRFAVEEGETVFACLSRAARARGLLMLTNGDGDLVFDRAGATRIKTVLKRGENIISGSRKNSMRNRYSEYTIKTQSAGTDELGRKGTSIKRSSTDEGVTRYRPLVIVADGEDSGTELQKRADWERNVRAGKSKRLSYSVHGWEHSDGLWQPNTLVRVVDPDARIDDELLIVTVTQSRDTGGTITSLDLTLKEAFDVQPLPPPKKSQKSGALW